jgi:surface carbohydrate biosynthesis protein
MSGLTPTLYLPVEEVNRELDSKLLIALELLGDNVTVIIGRNPLFVANYGSMPRGAVLFKGMNAIPAFVMKQAAGNGHLVLATDEEGLGLAETNVMRRNIDRSVGTTCQILFAQGRRHAKAMEIQNPGATDRIKIVGNARLDLLRAPFKSAYLEEANEHRRTYGDYVMVDTNFGAINSQWGDAETFKKILERVGYLDPTNLTDQKYYDRHLRTENANITLLRRTLERLSKRFPEITFIVRPHPAERDRPWRKAYGNHSNIVVTAEGSHIPWILGAKLMLHTGCTTGLEAEVLEAPCLTLIPPEHESLITADLLSNLANERAIGIENAVAAATRILTGDGSGGPSERENRLLGMQEHVEALDGRFAYQRIADEIKEQLLPALKKRPDFDWRSTDVDAFVTTREHYERRLGENSRTGYIWSKGEIDLATLQKRLTGLVKTTGSVLMPRISEVADGVFRLNKATG